MKKISNEMKQITKTYPLVEKLQAIETEKKLLEIVENFELPNLPVVEAKWDEKLQCAILPKEELTDWEWDD